MRSKESGMSDGSKIEWTDATWNCVTGCTKVSPGCDHCYAETFAERWRGTPGHHFENGFDVQIRPERLRLPLTWRKPKRVFVNSMSDVFHEAVPDEFIDRMFAVMADTPQHTYQVLTKRHARMRSYLGRTWPDPLPNVWVGVSAEDQKWADIRVSALVETPAAVRFVSAEPLLGQVDFRGLCQWLDWVIVGGESGPGARPMDLAWARWIAEQCADSDTACFVKQLGSGLGRQLGAGPKGGDWDAWPDDLRIREFPAPAAIAA
jgi:protein gp37